MADIVCILEACGSLRERQLIPALAEYMQQWLCFQDKVEDIEPSWLIQAGAEALKPLLTPITFKNGGWFGSGRGPSHWQAQENCLGSARELFGKRKTTAEQGMRAW